jgi:peptidoglycan-associated lipoprotein
MMICQAAVMLMALVMAITLGGCATEMAGEPSATAGVRATFLPGPRLDVTGIPSGRNPSLQSGAARPRLGDFVENAELRDIHFAFDRSDLTPEARQTLDGLAEALRNLPNLTLLVEGHADERGTPEYNLALGARRADAAKAYLVSRGMAANRIATVSYGEERPLDPAHTEAAWTLNRRAHFVVRQEP